MRISTLTLVSCSLSFLFGCKKNDDTQPKQTAQYVVVKYKATNAGGYLLAPQYGTTLGGFVEAIPETGSYTSPKALGLNDTTSYRNAVSKVGAYLTVRLKFSAAIAPNTNTALNAEIFVDGVSVKQITLDKNNAAQANSKIEYTYNF